MILATLRAAGRPLTACEMGFHGGFRSAPGTAWHGGYGAPSIGGIHGRWVDGGRFWHPGYWGWSGGARVWIGPGWGVGFYPGCAWVQPGWVWNGYQWVWQEGYWAPPY